MISANPKVFGEAEQKMSPQPRELCGIISALQAYEFYIIYPHFKSISIVITDQFYFFGHDVDK